MPQKRQEKWKKIGKEYNEMLSCQVIGTVVIRKKKDL